MSRRNNDQEIADHLDSLAESVRKEAWLATRPGQMDRLGDIAELMTDLAKDVREG